MGSFKKKSLYLRSCRKCNKLFYVNTKRGIVCFNCCKATQKKNYINKTIKLLEEKLYKWNAEKFIKQYKYLLSRC